MTKIHGRKITAVDELVKVFNAPGGEIHMIYGLIGNGKTYAATADVLDRARRGSVEYANWFIKVPDHDDRLSFFYILRSLLFPWKNRFYFIPCSKNIHYFNLSTDTKMDKDCPACGQSHIFEDMPELVAWLSSLNGCVINFDEGQDIFDSYEGTRFSKAKRRMILHTRHYHRTLNIISQRPTAIQVSARGNVNRYYKCEKIASWPWLRFARYEYQKMSGDTVDETEDPITVKRYWASKSVFKAYNTDYLAEGIAKSQEVNFEAFELCFKERLFAFWHVLVSPFAGLSRKRRNKALEAFPKT